MDIPYELEITSSVSSTTFQNLSKFRTNFFPVVFYYFLMHGYRLEIFNFLMVSSLSLFGKTPLELFLI